MMLRRVLSIVVIVLCLASSFGTSAKTLRMAAWFEEPADLIEAFEEATGITVEYTYVPDSRAYLEKVTLWAISGTLPDVLYIPYWGLFPMTDVGVLHPLDGFLSEDFEEDFLPQGILSFQRDGRQFGMPWELNPMVIIYDQRIFERYALATPDDYVRNDDWNAESLVESARKTTKLTPDRTNFETIGLVTWSNAINRFTSFIWVFGGDVLAEDGATVLLDQPGSIAALEQLASLFQEERVFMATGQRGRYGLEFMEILAGDITAMRGADIPLLNNIRMENSDLARNVGVVPMPLAPDGAPTSGLIVHGIGIAASSEQKEEAWQFIEFAMNNVAQNASIPARQSQVADWIDYISREYGFNVMNYVQGLEKNLRLQPRAINDQVEAILNTYVDRILTQGVPVVTAVENAIREIGAIL